MIVFSKVSLIYPNSTRTVIEDLSMNIAEGEFVLVIGPTGSGKSSLLRLINGLVPHHTGGILAGDISVNGISTQSVKPGGLAHLIGIVGQNPLNGFVADTVEEELVFGMEALNLPAETMRKRVEEILDLLSLAPLRNRSIATLSGGEQQRVAIGSALVMHPKVLVLDEPTSALDPIAAEEVLSILHRLVHDLSLTVVIAEHKLERVIQFADRIIQINSQGASEIGKPEEIMKTSDIAPPIVHLARALGLTEVGLTVREVRRMSEGFRSQQFEIQAPVEVIPGGEIIRISKLEVSYEKKLALIANEISMNEGEIIAIMGRNGAGKSSLLRAIAGINSHANGSITISGMETSKLKGSLRRSHIAFVPQEPSDLLYAQSVELECSQADKDNGVESGVTYALLNELTPGILKRVHPRDLSEGQRLALALSIVLSAKPLVLILDEPTRGLDYQAKKSLTKVLINYAKVLKQTIILATHDVELVAELATRVIFIADGEIVADGPTIEVLLSSPAFAPQVAKVMSPARWLTVTDVIKAIQQ